MSEDHQSSRAAEERIEHRVAASKSAKVIAELVIDEADALPEYFWEVLFKKLAQYVPVPEETVNKQLPFKPMTQQQAKLFGNQPMPYGQFQGKRIDEVPLDRLQWYADQSFTDDLRRYLTAERISGEADEQ